MASRKRKMLQKVRMKMQNNSVAARVKSGEVQMLCNVSNVINMRIHEISKGGNNNDGN